MFPDGIVTGELHIFIAFDWGDEIDVEQARRLVPSSFVALARRRRTPPSFSFDPAPLHVALQPLLLELPEVGRVQAAAAITIFDFAAVSLSLRLPFRVEPAALVRLAGALADATTLVQAGQEALQPLHQQILPAIRSPSWKRNLSEEYFVFRLSPEAGMRSEAVLAEGGPWLAGLVHLEVGALSKEEIAEALRLHISYSPEDLFIPDWTAAILIDRDCDETLQTIEFANLQLLEFRHIDDRLDQSLAEAARVVHPARRTLPFLRRQLRPLRTLGELKVEATGLFERAGNALKLVGDAYLARVYRLVASRFHLDTWEENIQRKLDVAEGIYQVAFDQASTLRAEFLETVVVILILIEIIVALIAH